MPGSSSACRWRSWKHESVVLYHTEQKSSEAVQHYEVLDSGVKGHDACGNIQDVQGGLGGRQLRFHMPEACWCR